MKNKKVKNVNKKIVIAVLVLVIAVALSIFFGIKSTKNKNGKNEKDSTVVLYNYNGEEEVSSINIEFKDGKVNDIILTLFFNDKNIAKEIAGIYSNQNEFVGVKADGTNVVMHYSNDEINKLSKFSKSHVLSEFEKEGYISKK